MTIPEAKIWPEPPPGRPQRHARFVPQEEFEPFIGQTAWRPIGEGPAVAWVPDEFLADVEPD